jgi:hypothetical protein
MATDLRLADAETAIAHHRVAFLHFTAQVVWLHGVLADLYGSEGRAASSPECMRTESAARYSQDCGQNVRPRVGTACRTRQLSDTPIGHASQLPNWDAAPAAGHHHLQPLAALIGKLAADDTAPKAEDSDLEIGPAAVLSPDRNRERWNQPALNRPGSQRDTEPEACQ